MANKSGKMSWEKITKKDYIPWDLQTRIEGRSYRSTLEGNMLKSWILQYLRKIKDYAWRNLGQII